MLSLLQNLQELLAFSQLLLFINFNANIRLELLHHTKGFCCHVFGQRLVVPDTLKVLDEFLSLIFLVVNYLFKLLILVGNLFAYFIFKSFLTPNVSLKFFCADK